jgi:hypothetical protein
LRDLAIPILIVGSGEQNTDGQPIGIDHGPGFTTVSRIRRDMFREMRRTRANPGLSFPE